MKPERQIKACSRAVKKLLYFAQVFKHQGAKTAHAVVAQGGHVFAAFLHNFLKRLVTLAAHPHFDQHARNVSQLNLPLVQVAQHGVVIGGNSQAGVIVPPTAQSLHALKTV